MTPPGSHQNRITEQRMQCFTLAALHKADTIAHLVHCNRRTLPIQKLQLPYDLCCRRDLGRFTTDFQFIAAADEPAIKVLYQNPQMLIPFAEQRIGFLMIFENDLLF